MALLEKQLVVKKSSLPGSGKGLFTKTFIAKGTRIVEYKGKISTWKDVRHHEGTNGYIYYVKRYHVIDALPFKKAYGRYANDAKGIAQIKGLHNNSQYMIDGLRVFIESTKDISPNTEILVNYGKEYWKIIRFNKRIEQKKKKAAAKR